MSDAADAIGRIVLEWAAADPRIRRIWILGSADRDSHIAVAVEPEPVPDSEETLAVWMANCGEWHLQLRARTGRAVRLEWRDQDVADG